MDMKLSNLLTFLILAVYIRSLEAIDLEKALKMAQCRAHCINKFDNASSVQDDKLCKEKSDCFMCWLTCEKLSTDFPIWSFNCGQKTRCDSGCQTACDFLTSSQDTMVPLSPFKSRLTLIFSGSSAEWSLEWGKGVPAQKVVFALFTRETGRPWRLRVQTANYKVVLHDVLSGTEMKLVAVAQSGLLSVIITPFEPLHNGSPQNEFPWNKDNVVRGDVEQGWPLMYRANVEESGLVNANVRWSTQQPKGSNYLVTWEVDGGGLKGHLYTDIPDVDLTLWPNTVYKVQVELVTRPLGEIRISQLLILDTHNISAVAQEDTIFAVAQEDDPFQPLVKVESVTETSFRLEIIIGGILGALTAVTVITMLIYRRSPCKRNNFNDSSSSNSKLTLTRSVTDFAFEESLMRAKMDSSPPILPVRLYSSPPTLVLGPQNTLGIPNQYSFPPSKHSSISII